jgi:hypothetical protein
MAASCFWVFTAERILGSVWLGICILFSGANGKKTNFNLFMSRDKFKREWLVGWGVNIKIIGKAEVALW